MFDTDALTALLAATLADKGATLTRDGFATEGFAVAGIAPAVRIPQEALTVEVLAAAVFLFGKIEALGTWLYDGEFWIEPTEVYATREEAVSVGRARGEIAIFDLGEGEEITL